MLHFCPLLYFFSTFPIRCFYTNLSVRDFLVVLLTVALLRHQHSLILLLWISSVAFHITFRYSKNIYCEASNFILTNDVCGPGSSVAIATGYELDDPGIESWWGPDFPQLSRPALGPTQPPVNGYRVFPEGRGCRGVGLTPQPPSSAEVLERVELYLYSS